MPPKKKSTLLSKLLVRVKKEAEKEEGPAADWAAKVRDDLLLPPKQISNNSNEVGLPAVPAVPKIPCAPSVWTWCDEWRHRNPRDNLGLQGRVFVSKSEGMCLVGILSQGFTKISRCALTSSLALCLWKKLLTLEFYTLQPCDLEEELKLIQSRKQRATATTTSGRREEEGGSAKSHTSEESASDGAEEEEYEEEQEDDDQLLVAAAGDAPTIDPVAALVANRKQLATTQEVARRGLSRLHNVLPGNFFFFAIPVTAERIREFHCDPRPFHYLVRYLCENNHCDVLDHLVHNLQLDLGEVLTAADRSLPKEYFQKVVFRNMFVIPIQQGFDQMMQVLIDSGASLEADAISGSGGNTDSALHLAIKCDRPKILAMLIRDGDVVSKSGAELFFQGNSGGSPDNRSMLHLAAQQSGKEVMEILLALSKEKGLNGGVDVRSRRDYETPLHVAVRRSDTSEVAKVLLKNHADVNARNHSGCTPLFLACSAEPDEDDGVAAEQALLTTKMVSVLLDHRALSGLQCTHGQTALHAAIRQENIEVAKVLLERGKADVDATDDQRQTALHYVCSRKDHKKSRRVSQLLIALLLKHKASPASADIHGQTPLHLAVGKAQDLEMVKALIVMKGGAHHRGGQRGVDPRSLVNQSDTAGWAPYDLSVYYSPPVQLSSTAALASTPPPSSNYQEIRAFLRMQGAEPQVTSQLHPTLRCHENHPTTIYNLVPETSWQCRRCYQVYTRQQDVEEIIRRSGGVDLAQPKCAVCVGCKYYHCEKCW